MKTLSIIIPTKNSSAHLEELLRSIAKQTVKAHEVMVVDNYSVDNTISIASSFGIKVFQKGPERSAQKNFGALKANGDYLLFLDSDTHISPRLVEDCLVN